MRITKFQHNKASKRENYEENNRVSRSGTGTYSDTDYKFEQNINKHMTITQKPVPLYLTD